MPAVKKRNAQARELAAGRSAAARRYRDTAPLQGTLARHSRCVVCQEWVEMGDYNPARCAACAEGGHLF